jgi:lauroyl/myristoyl acyltransferase
MSTLDSPVDSGSADPQGRPSRESPFAHNSLFWRRLARLGAAHFPAWWMRYSPPAFGVAAALAVPTARRAVAANLRRIRGPVPPLRDATEIAETFITYANCLSEVLAYGSKNAELPELVRRGGESMTLALAEKKGVVMITAHTAGWDVAGPLFGKDHRVNLVMVMEPEPNEAARQLHDEARRASGVEFVHVGSDPFASLPLLQRLRKGAVVATQIDRVPRTMRSRAVRLFGAPARVPEGPLRLAQVSGAPIVPMFCARLGFRRYLADVGTPIRVPRHASEETLDAVAQQMADSMTSFLRRHPTQWFHFGSD